MRPAGKCVTVSSRTGVLRRVIKCDLEIYILLVYRLRTVAFQVAETGSIPVQDAKQYAAVTQWIRVLRYERRSQEFESLRWRHALLV